LVRNHFPDRPSPTQQTERAHLPKVLAPVSVHAPAFAKLPQQFRTKRDLGVALWEAAMQPHVPLRILLCASWSLAEARVALARYRHKDGSSVRTQQRNLAPHSVIRPDATGHPSPLEGPPSAVVSNRVAWHAPRLLPWYGQRWPIEPFDQAGTGHRGWDTSRMRSAKASGKHGGLVCVAYSLWHLDCLPSSPSTGSWPVQTIGEACRQQAHALLEALLLSAHKQLQLGQQAIDLLAA
jgi:hypothetical protein